MESKVQRRSDRGKAIENYYVLQDDNFQCNICNSIIQSKKNQISHLESHIQRVHPNVMKEIDATHASAPKLHHEMIKHNPEDAEKCFNLLINFITMNGLPLSIVDSTSFREFVSAICPSFGHLSAKTLTTKYIPNAFNKMKQKLLLVCLLFYFILFEINIIHVNNNINILDRIFLQSVIHLQLVQILGLPKEDFRI